MYEFPKDYDGFLKDYNIKEVEPGLVKLIDYLNAQWSGDKEGAILFNPEKYKLINGWNV